METEKAHRLPTKLNDTSSLICKFHLGTAPQSRLCFVQIEKKSSLIDTVPPSIGPFLFVNWAFFYNSHNDVLLATTLTVKIPKLYYFCYVSFLMIL